MCQVDILPLVPYNAERPKAVKSQNGKEVHGNPHQNMGKPHQSARSRRQKLHFIPFRFLRLQSRGNRFSLENPPSLRGTRERKTKDQSSKHGHAVRNSFRGPAATQRLHSRWRLRRLTDIAYPLRVNDWLKPGMTSPRRSQTGAGACRLGVFLFSLSLAWWENRSGLLVLPLHKILERLPPFWSLSLTV